MSEENNTKFSEQVGEHFQELLAAGNWPEINKLFIELQDEGFAFLEPQLIEEMSTEQLTEWSKWQYDNSDQRPE